MVKIIMMVMIGMGAYRIPGIQTPGKSRSKTMRNGEFTIKNPQAYILLVDDDGGDYDNPQGDTLYPDLQSYWVQALDIYYSGEYDVYEIKQNGPGPDTSVLKNYSVVIWYTGETWSPQYWSTLQVEDEQNLGIYLDSLGGSLLLTSQDYFYDRYPNAGNFSSGQFPYDYLGLQSVSQDILVVFGGTFEGDSGTVFEGFSGYFNSNGVYSDSVPCWLDSITSYDAQRNLVAKDSSGSTFADVGFQRDTGTYRVIYSNLGFEVITDLNTRAGIIHSAIEWLRGMDVQEKEIIYSDDIKVSGNIISYSLSSGKKLKLSIYDPSGRMINSLFLSGRGKTRIRGKPGIYILKGNNIKAKVFILR